MSRSRSQFRDSAGRTLTDYPRPSVAVDVAVLTVPEGASELHVLLVERQGSYETGRPGLPGTFLHEKERLSQAVLRCLRDKAGLEGVFPRQLRVLDDPDRDDRGWVLSVAHVDVVPWPRVSGTSGRLVPVSRATCLPFDHDLIVHLACEEVRQPYRTEPDPDRLLAAEFTLLELRRLHEAVLGQLLVKDTFRRTMQPHLVATHRLSSGAIGKPAQLFTHPVTGQPGPAAGR